MTNPYQNTATAKLITDRIRDLSHRKTQAEIASDAGFRKREHDDLSEKRPEQAADRPSAVLWRKLSRSILRI